MNGWLTLRWQRILRSGSLMFLSILLTLGVVNMLFTYVVPHTYTKDKILAELNLLRISDPSSARVFQEPPPPVPLDPSYSSRLNQIQQRGFLRACYAPDRYPLSYTNAEEDLVGANVEMVHLLAHDLGVRIEFVPLSIFGLASFDMVAEQLNEGYCDIYATMLAITPSRTQLVTLLTPISSGTVGFLVADNRRDRFSSWAALQELETLQIGYFHDIPYYLAKVKELLPQAEWVPVDSLIQELESGMPDIDAFLGLVELATSWTLLYPDFSVAIPTPLFTAPLTFAIPHDDRPFQDWMDAWLQLKKQDGTLQSLFDYWVQGKTEATRSPRWSVIRDVLHWVE